MLLLVAGDDTLDLDNPDAGYAIQSVDFAAPSSRAVVNDRPGTDGNVDQTSHVGARAVTINLEVLPEPASRQALLDDLARFLHPRTRLDIYVATELDGPVRRLSVRPDQFSAPMEQPWHVAMSLGFVTVGTPFLRSIDINRVTFAPYTGVVIGRTYDRTYPRTYAAAPSSSVIVTNDGDQPAHWVARIDGPVTGPKIRNETLGLEVSFPTLTIAAGSYVEVNSEERTVLADSVSNRYSTVDFLNSDWWQLEPGPNAVNMPTVSSDTPAQGTLSWYDTFLL